MILWIIAGSVAWIVCVSLMLVVIKGGHRVRGDGYEQKLYAGSMGNTQKIGNLIKKERKKATRTKRDHGLLVS